MTASTETSTVYRVEWRTSTFSRGKWPHESGNFTYIYVIIVSEDWIARTSPSTPEGEAVLTNKHRFRKRIT